MPHTPNDGIYRNICRPLNISFVVADTDRGWKYRRHMRISLKELHNRMIFRCEYDMPACDDNIGGATSSCYRQSQKQFIYCTGWVLYGHAYVDTPRISITAGNVTYVHQLNKIQNNWPLSANLIKSKRLSPKIKRMKFTKTVTLISQKRLYVNASCKGF